MIMVYLDKGQPKFYLFRFHFRLRVEWIKLTAVYYYLEQANKIVYTIVWAEGYISQISFKITSIISSEGNTRWNIISNNITSK